MQAVTQSQMQQLAILASCVTGALAVGRLKTLCERIFNIPVAQQALSTVTSGSGAIEALDDDDRPLTHYIVEACLWHAFGHLFSQAILPCLFVTYILTAC